MNFKAWFDGALLMESKQSIIGLGYPEIIAKLLYQKCEDNAFLIARWYKEYRSKDEDANWWNREMSRSFTNDAPVADLCQLYNATFDAENYVRVADHLDFPPPQSPVDEVFLSRRRQELKAQIEKTFFSEYFFEYYQLIKDIITGKLTDIAPYKRMPFREAAQKYEERKIFSDTTPIKMYKDGFKWINVGKKCPLVGGLMGNCGSVGVMSLDRDATMITLFGPDNKPHVVVTYSPNDKRISGVEGGASSVAKTKYHKYILDLVEVLGGNYDYARSRSTLLRMKYILRDKAKNIRQINGSITLGDVVFQFTIDGKAYYSDDLMALAKEEAERAIDAVKRGLVTLPFKGRTPIMALFNYRNKETLRQYGIQYVAIDELVRS